MPELQHQAIIQILRDEPQFVAALLGRIGFTIPSGSYPVIADSDLSHRSAHRLKELRADNVFLFPGIDETIVVVVEVQTTRPNSRASTSCRSLLVATLACRPPVAWFSGLSG
jgi:hypothetical protein